MDDLDLDFFVEESNLIEGIDRAPTQEELQAHAVLIRPDATLLSDVALFVRTVAGARLRVLHGMNVRVGAHVAPPGGPDIAAALQQLLGCMNDGKLDPFEAHRRYETLHPFMDGNGRSGRALWLWQMLREERPVYGSSFLRTWYYHTLSEGR